MSSIVKTEAIVLNKINYGDSSLIYSLYTKDFGKISTIIKGAKSAKSKTGKQADILNHISIVFYKKETRDIQLVSSADVISHFPEIKTDLDKLKYAYAIIELLNYMLPDGEVNDKIFRGAVRILNLINNPNERESVIFLRFFLFLLKETGYELQFDECNKCNKIITDSGELFYNFDYGIFCRECKNHIFADFRISRELFNLLICLKNNLNSSTFYNEVITEAAGFFESYLRHHLPDFPGLKALKNF